MSEKKEDEKLILYRFHAHGVAGRAGEIQIALDPPVPPTPNPTWAYDDAENIYKMLQNFIPKITVDIVAEAFLTKFTIPQLLKELERRVG